MKYRVIRVSPWSLRNNSSATVYVAQKKLLGFFWWSVGGIWQSSEEAWGYIKSRHEIKEY